MKIKYWGTGASEGLPAVFCDCENCQKARRLGGKNIRTRSQMLINDDLLVDFGPDTYLHALQNNFSLMNIKNVLITHCHEDHLYLDDLLTRAEPYGNARDVMHVYGNDMLKAVYQYRILKDGLKENVDKTLDIVEVFENCEYTVVNYRVMPLLADHNPMEKCYIYTIAQGGKTILYANDTGYFKEETWKALEGRYFDLVSLDCNHIGMEIYDRHMSIPCCRKVKERLWEMGCIDEKSICVLTHFSHNHGGLQEELERETSDMGVIIAYDGLEIEI